MKRAFDIVSATVGLLVLSPLFILIAIAVMVDSPGGPLYTQARVGRFNQDFFLLKFRTMHTNADKKGQLTVGAKDARITRVGYYLRKFKLDELPQLLNIILGDMSVVGPRPEVRKYVYYYNERQKQVLNVRPGLTDYASIKYFNENEVLGEAENPEKTYLEKIMPEKLELNLQYIKDQSLGTDLKIIFQTIGKIFK